MTYPDSLDGLAQCPPYDEREQQLWLALVRDGHASTRETLFEVHLPYATALAGQLYRNRHHDDVEFKDYLQFACVGLLETIDRFDPARNIDFKTFATQRIKGNVLDGIVRLSDGQEQVALRAQIRRERLESLNDVSGKRTNEVFQSLASLTIGLAIGFILDDTGMVDRPAHASPFNQDHAYHSLAWSQTRDRVHSAVANLPERERKIVQHHYFHGLTFSQIGDILDLSKGRVSQLHRAALTALRGHIRTTEDLYLIA